MDAIKSEAQALYGANTVIYALAQKLLDIKAANREDVVKAAKLMQESAAHLSNIDAELCEVELEEFRKATGAPVFSQRSGEK
ncbi:hypothetical protein [Paenilisteria rocourtiae]|uniref:Uncharacterized protein n=1 Tax=Listeria rocourtiae TaxID=647910 RepID=A0A4R6ZR27_9LIST|nr:hypothetical protein [Listeria rocourtiae]EUJ44428.1 hypothetical protein PROCOU_14033 [Listeria rocourtiae FSL F6-920]TDR55090.1 hypothetical protein DFP96_10116 [Listeria rocourtiae]